MRAKACLMCLWPGLAPLWIDGRGVGLIVAAAFAAALNGVLVCSFVWPGLLGPLGMTAAWVALGGFWLGGVWRDARRVPQLCITTADPACEALFVEAQTEYLKGHWFEAETLLAQLLRRNPRDVEAQLLLASLCRHTGRTSQARGLLRQLERQEGAGRWRLEMASERRLLAETPEAEKAVIERTSPAESRSKVDDESERDDETANERNMANKTADIGGSAGRLAAAESDGSPGATQAAARQSDSPPARKAA